MRRSRDGVANRDEIALRLDIDVKKASRMTRGYGKLAPKGRDAATGPSATRYLRRPATAWSVSPRCRISRMSAPRDPAGRSRRCSGGSLVFTPWRGAFRFSFDRRTLIAAPA